MIENIYTLVESANLIPTCLVIGFLINSIVNGIGLGIYIIIGMIRKGA